VHDLIGELNDLLGPAHEMHQRHGLSIEQLFEPHVRFFVARLDGVVVGCGGVAGSTITQRSSGCTLGQRHAVEGSRKLC
jgi:hypothetical protein